MLTLAATTTQTAATDSNATLDALVGLLPVAALFLALWTAGYLIRCWLFPFTRCRHTNRTLSRCWDCDGTGQRLRAGRRLLNHIGATRRRYHR
ncbi:MAG TPA: hypothetical protein VGD71_16685 [Kribbella sp.]|jgi:hypothetical protein